MDMAGSISSRLNFLDRCSPLVEPKCMLVGFKRFKWIETVLDVTRLSLVCFAISACGREMMWCPLCGGVWDLLSKEASLWLNFFCDIVVEVCVESCESFYKPIELFRQ